MEQYDDYFPISARVDFKLKALKDAEELPEFIELQNETKTLMTTAAIEAIVPHKVPPPVSQMPTQEGKCPVQGRCQGLGTKVDAEGKICPQGGIAKDQGHVWFCRGRIKVPKTQC
jgi:hypothetical protein